MIATVCLLALVLFCADDTLAQCSMCKKIATDGTNNTRSIANGLNKGILYMLAFPYAMIAFIFRKQIIEYFSRFRKAKS